MKAVPTVSIAPLPKIVARIAGGEPHLHHSVDEDVHLERFIRLVLIPSVPGNLGAGQLFHQLVMGGRRVGGESAGKEEKTKRHRVEGEQDVADLPFQATGEPVSRFVPTRKGIVAAENRRMVNAVKDVIPFRAMPYAHDAESEKKPNV